MKNITTIIILLLIINTISCNKKEEEANQTNIVGEWVANSQAISGCSDGSDGSEDILTCTEDNCITYSFDKEGIYTSNVTIDGETFGEQGTYSLKEDKITFCQEDDDLLVCESGSFDVGSVSLVLTTTDQDTGCTTTLIFERPSDQ